MLDSDPVEVMAMFDRAPVTGQVEMLAMVLTRYANGAMAYLNCNERIVRPRNDLAIYGSSGRITGDQETETNYPDPSGVDGLRNMILCDAIKSPES